VETVTRIPDTASPRLDDNKELTRITVTGIRIMRAEPEVNRDRDRIILDYHEANWK
jgi:hypothetical protein